MPLLAVNHHYFRNTGTGRGIFPTTPQDLEIEVNKIRAAGWRLGNQNDLSALISETISSDEKICVLTFDDGLHEQMKAINLLEKMETTAICFVPTAPIMEGYVLDVHKLQMIRSNVDDDTLSKELENKFNYQKHEFDDQVLAIQYRYDNPLARRIKYFLNFILDHESRCAWTSRYFSSLFGNEREIARDLYMSRDDLKYLAKKQILGSHAHTHVPLATLDNKLMQHEIHHSRTILEEITGTAPIGISYPYGGKSAVNDDVFECASSFGYAYGFTMERGNNSHTGPLQAMKLMRIDVNDLDAWLTESGATLRCAY